jgi:hypothetical protein
MASAVRITMWGQTFPGREKQALQLFADASQFYLQKKAQGEIEGYESIIFDHIGSDLSGMSIQRGEPDKLYKLSQSEEVVNLGLRAELCLSNFRVVSGFVGEIVQKRMMSWAKLAAQT